MKDYNVFSRKNKKNISECGLLKLFLPSSTVDCYIKKKNPALQSSFNLKPIKL